MVAVLKMLFFLIILQLAITSTLNGMNLDDANNQVAATHVVAVDDDATYADNDDDDDDDDDGATVMNDDDDAGTVVDDDDDTATVVDDDDDNAKKTGGNSEETSDKAVYGYGVFPDAKVCGDATFKDNMIALAPEDVWDTVKNQKCTAQMEVQCLSGIFRSENACLPKEGNSVVSVVVTIIGSTGTNGPPIKYPIATANPPTYVLHEDAYYKIASKTNGMINIHKSWITSSTAEKGSEPVQKTISA